MANLTESPIYEPGIFQLEKSTPPLGGAPVIDNGVPSAGHANAQGLQLANRTAYLKQETDSLDARVDTAETDIDNLQAQVTAGGSATTLRGDLGSSTDSAKGATLVGVDGTTVSDQILKSRKLANYTALRAYTGNASIVEITDSQLKGTFFRKTSGTDNNGETIVSSNGIIWQRVYSGAVSASWFSVNVNATDCVVGIKSAIAVAQAKGGGTVLLPSGVLACSSGPLGINPIPSSWQNIDFVGEGSGSTILDFTNSPANSGGVIIYGYGGRINLKGFSVVNAKGVGIEMNPVNRGSGSFVSRVSAEDIIVDGSALDGFRFTQTYMCSFRDIESRNNGGYGFNLRGSHTSMTFNRCWAGGDAVKPNGGNTSGGWMVNGLVYSSFESCSADNNAGPGWTIKATGGVTLTSCGSEANVGAGFLAVSDDNNIDAIPTPGINGLILDGCFAVNNGSASPATPNFLEFRTAGTRAGDIALRGCYDIIVSGGPGSLVSTAWVGSGGPLVVEETVCHFAGTRSKTGNTYTKNSTVVGKNSIAKLAADTSIANATNVVLLFTAFDSNRLASTLNAGGVVIPTGVNRIKINGGLFWNTNSVGVRTVTFYKNGVAFYGGSTQKNAGSGFTTQTLSTATVEVVAGDIITCVVFQDSGAALNIISNPNTFMSIEAMG